MKPELDGNAGRRAQRLGLPLAATLLLLAALPMTAADTPYTATGWVLGVPVPGIWCTNAQGQVGLRGNAHLAQVVGTDPRLTGRRTIYVDGAVQADGSSILYGPVYHEVGTWDATGTNFTATGGMWEISYRGFMGTNGSLQLHLLGSGWGGTIDGLCLDETLTRVAGPTLDPTLPYLYTGTIKPPPLNTNAVVDNFDDNKLIGFTWWGYGTLVESNMQFNAIGSFAGLPPTTSLWDTYLFGGWGLRNGIVPNGRTLEWRADLVSLNENATNMATLAVGNENYGAYYLEKGRDFAFVWKWVSGYSNSMLACDRVATPNTNVVLALALTRVQPNLVITARVLDKADPNIVLYERTVVDTPNADPTVSSNQFQALTGMRFVDLAPDPAGIPLTYFGLALGVFQYTDGTSPAPKAVFDNLALWTSEVPRVGVERAVRLSWPASSTINYSIEGAPTVQGPWRPVQDPVLPGLQQMSLPANDNMGFFRLRQTP